MRTRPLPVRKSLGTEYNLRPDTERVQARVLRVGDVVMEDFDHPFLIHRFTYPHNRIAVHGKYVWQQPWEATWEMGRFNPIHMFERAIPGEY